MEELTGDGIKPRSDGTRPLDEVIRNLAADHAVIYYMLPTPEATACSLDKLAERRTSGRKERRRPAVGVSCRYN